MENELNVVLENISALRVDLYDCKLPPRDYIRGYEPENALNSAWIPQTICEQIWVLYEFKSQTERLEFEASLPAEVSRWLDRTLLPHALTYGWKTLDLNGFTVEKTQ